MKSALEIDWQEPLEYLTEDILDGGRRAVVYHGDNAEPAVFYTRMANCFTDAPVGDKYRNRYSAYNRAVYCVLDEQTLLGNGYGPYFYKLSTDPRKYLHCDYTTYKEAFPESTSTETTFHYDQIHKSGIFKDPDKEKLAAKWLMQTRWEECGRNGADVCATIGSSYPEIFNAFSGISYSGHCDGICMIAFDYSALRPMMWSKLGMKTLKKTNSIWRQFERDTLKSNTDGMLNRLNSGYNENLESNNMMFTESEILKFSKFSDRAESFLDAGDEEKASDMSYELANIMKKKLDAIISRIRTTDSLFIHQLMSSIISSNNSILKLHTKLNRTRNYDMIIDLTPILKTACGSLALYDFYKYVKDTFENRDENRLKEFGDPYNSGYGLTESRGWTEFLQEVQTRITNMYYNVTLLCLDRAASSETEDGKIANIRFLGTIEPPDGVRHWSDALRALESNKDLNDAIEGNTAIGYNTEDYRELGRETEIIRLTFPKYKRIIDFLYGNGNNGSVRICDEMYEMIFKSMMDENGLSPSSKADEFYDMAQKITVDNEGSWTTMMLECAKKGNSGMETAMYSMMKITKTAGRGVLAALRLAEMHPAPGKFAFFYMMRTNPELAPFLKNLFEYVR